jgi:non-specific serine/threonine protein kinase/NIMA (never in mitosis gene a)-related kinase
MEKYDPIKVLGEGSFGKVYLMRDKVNRKFLCVKVIKIKNIPKKEREATKMEVDLLRRLNHPNIVHYKDSFLSQGGNSLCIAMEYCDGGDLASQIKAARRQLFSENKILHWFVQIALGLHYMHTNKVLHRDLKSQNIFLLGNGRLVLGDLGISKVLDGTMDFAQTQIGTPYYMSPEIFKNKPYSYKSDVWALGCLLYEMTTLNHAFDAQSMNGLAQKIIKGRYPPISPKYSKYLRELISQMLHVSPGSRPDLDQILRKPFVKKHVVNFFTDITARPSGNIGEGTIIVRAAAGERSNFSSKVEGDVVMKSLKAQLRDLDFDEAIRGAMAPKSKPKDSVEATRLAKEQAGALRREQDHKAMVQGALEKLRKEREQRARERNAIPSYQRDQQRGPRHARAGRQDYRDRERDRLAAIAEADARAKDKERESRRAQVDEQRRRAERDRVKAAEAAEEEREAALRVRERDRKERERREEQEKLERQEKAHAAAMAKREADREKERARQREEIEQLKKDKMELDRRALEREKQRVERWQEERRKIEAASGRDSDRSERDNRDNRSRPSRRNEGSSRDESKEPSGSEDSEGLSARDRVIQKKQERMRLEEQERAEALLAAESENRRIRAAAYHQHRDQYSAHAIPGLPSVPASNEPSGYEFDNARKPAPGGSGSGSNRPPAAMNMDELSKQLEGAVGGQSRFNEAPSSSNANDSNIGGGKGKYTLDSSDDEASDDAVAIWDRRPVDAEGFDDEEDIRKSREAELEAELNNATKRCQELKRTLQETKSFINGKPSGGGSTSATTTTAAAAAAGKAAQVPPVADVDTEDEDDEDVFDFDEDSIVESPEASGIGNSGGTNSSADSPSSIYRYDKQALGIGSQRQSSDGSDAETPRHHQGLNLAVKPAPRQTPYHNLADPPSPSGRLADRIVRLKQRCVEALGQGAFIDVYTYLKQYEEEGYYQESSEQQKVSKVKGILGEGKAHYMPLIEQLIFMEETHAA